MLINNLYLFLLNYSRAYLTPLKDDFLIDQVFHLTRLWRWNDPFLFEVHYSINLSLPEVFSSPLEAEHYLGKHIHIKVIEPILRSEF